MTEVPNEYIQLLTDYMNLKIKLFNAANALKSNNQDLANKITNSIINFEKITDGEADIQMLMENMPKIMNKIKKKYGSYLIDE